MAFAQPQRRPRHRTHHTSTASEDDPVVAQPLTTLTSNTTQTAATTGVITYASSPAFTASTVSNSDSETDWHLISSVQRPSFFDRATFDTPPHSSRTTHDSFDRHTSPLSMGSSEQESYSSYRPSDTESFSDVDFAFDNLPSHDGTGTFMDAELDQTSEEEATQPLAVDCRSNATNRLSTSFRDFVPNSPNMPNILLPYGGIHLPSFVAKTNHDHATSSTDTPLTPTFRPTVIPEDMMLSTDEPTLSRKDGNWDSNKLADGPVVYTRKKKRIRNLDRIPTHHPSISGSITSLTILSALWSNLQRLTNHLIENDTCTADTFTSLASEASLEGCLPFGSHLHMELATGLRQD